jgi:hypothetical protein
MTFSYKTNNILLIHLDNSKNADKMTKKRRIFNRLAIFLGYEHGNVVCQLLYKDKSIHPKNVYEKPITLPIFYTKYLAKSFKEIPKAYLNLYF